MLDDFSRYILPWKLCMTVTATDVSDTQTVGPRSSGLERARVGHRLRLLSDNGPLLPLRPTQFLARRAWHDAHPGQALSSDDSGNVITVR